MRDFINGTKQRCQYGEGGMEKGECREKRRRNGGIKKWRNREMGELRNTKIYESLKMKTCEMYKYECVRMPGCKKAKWAD
jgi:hypothetical protein